MTLRRFIVLAGLLAAAACSREPDTRDLARMFAEPPMAYRPYVWWHWMGPNFSKEGIRKDLEAINGVLTVSHQNKTDVWNYDPNTGRLK